MDSEDSTPNLSYFAGAVLSWVAGTATFSGIAFLPFLERDNADKTTSRALAFAAGVMMYVSFFDVLGDEAKNFFAKHLTLTCNANAGMNALEIRILTAGYFSLGILMSYAVDQITTHRNDRAHTEAMNIEMGMRGTSISRRSTALTTPRDSVLPGTSIASTISRVSPPRSFTDHSATLALERVSFVTFLALTLHNVPEGLATFNIGANNSTAVMIATALRKFPEGAAIAIVAYQSNGVRKATTTTFLAGLAQPFGAALGWCFVAIGKDFPFHAYGAMYSVTAGMMVCVSLRDLIPEALERGPAHSVAACIFAAFFLIEVSIVCLDFSKATWASKGIGMSRD